MNACVTLEYSFTHSKEGKTNTINVLRLHINTHLYRLFRLVYDEVASVKQQNV